MPCVVDNGFSHFIQFILIGRISEHGQYVFFREVFPYFLRCRKCRSVGESRFVVDAVEGVHILLLFEFVFFCSGLPKAAPIIARLAMLAADPLRAARFGHFYPHVSGKGLAVQIPCAACFNYGGEGVKFCKVSLCHVFMVFENSLLMD
jgi:hypothetical protein